MYLFVVIGSAIVPIFEGGFFAFGRPFTISDQDFESVAVLLTYILLAMVDQVVTVISEEISNVSSFYPKNTNVSRETLHIVIGIVVYWQKLVFKYIVIRSQFAIILAVVVVDLTATFMFKDYVIRRRMNMKDGPFSFRLIPVGDTATIEESAHYQDIRNKFLVLEVVNMLLLGLVYILTGTTDTLYFSTNLPVDLVGHYTDNGAVVCIVALVVFFDQMVYGLLKRVVDDWFDTHVKHPDTELTDSSLNTTEIMFIHKVKHILYWSRLIFSLSFLTTRYYFVIPYTFGDVASGLFKYYNFTVKTIDAKEEESTANARKKMQADVLVLGTIFMTTELIIIGMIMIIPNFLDSRYFEWPEYIEIFRNTISGEHAIILIMIYAGLFQIGSTLVNEIVIPDFYNWMYGKSSESFVCCYGLRGKLFIIMLVRFDSWFRFLIVVQLVLSNLFFVIIVGTVDVIVSLVIMYHYVSLKYHINQAITHYQTFLDDR